nr:hypothetical protein [uncultured bacterium]
MLTTHYHRQRWHFHVQFLQSQSRESHHQPGCRANSRILKGASFLHSGSSA